MSAIDSDVHVTLSSDKVATGSGLFVSVVGRSVAGGGEYRAVLRTLTDGHQTLRLDRGSSVIAPDIVLPGIIAVPDRRMDVRVQAIGTNPTTIRAKAWETGTPEPAEWLRSTTDATAAMQQPGAIGFSIYLSSSATNGPITTAIHDLTAIMP